MSNPWSASHTPFREARFFGRFHQTLQPTHVTWKCAPIHRSPAASTNGDVPCQRNACWTDWWETKKKTNNKYMACSRWQKVFSSLSHEESRFSDHSWMRLPDCSWDKHDETDNTKHNLTWICPCTSRTTLCLPTRQSTRFAWSRPCPNSCATSRTVSWMGRT